VAAVTVEVADVPADTAAGAVAVSVKVPEEVEAVTVTEAVPVAVA
jgi:hypothetical protein